MVRRFQIFLGPTRFKTFILLLGITGLLSLILNVIVNDYDWVRNVQTLLVVTFIIGTAYLFGGRMPVYERLRWLAILLPAFGLVVIGVVFFPHVAGLFVGGGLGWILAGMFLFRGIRAPAEYRQAIKQMRKRNYEQAVEAMTRLIKQEPKEANHYRFRAELYRLWGKLGKAQRDYEKMIQLEPESAVAHNGLAEVFLQSGKFEQAHGEARIAYELAPEEWVAIYNLGMIEDRLERPEEAISSLTKALQMKIPDARHRLLVYLYMARAYSRLEELSSAEDAVVQMRKQKSGLEEWQVIMGSEEAATLRVVLEKDIQLAQALVDGSLEIAALAGNPVVST